MLWDAFSVFRTSTLVTDSVIMARSDGGVLVTRARKTRGQVLPDIA